MYKDWASKINGEALIGHRKISLLLFSSLINLCYRSEMHPSLQHLLIHFAVQYVDYHVQRVDIEKLIVAYCRVGREIFMWCAEWAMKKFPGKICLNPTPPGHK